MNMIEGMNDVYEVDPGVAIMVVICLLFLFLSSCVWRQCASQRGILCFLSFDRGLSCS